MLSTEIKCVLAKSAVQEGLVDLHVYNEKIKMVTGRIQEFDKIDHRVRNMKNGQKVRVTILIEEDEWK